MGSKTRASYNSTLSHHFLVLLLVLLLFINTGQISAFSYNECYNECYPSCKQDKAKWLRWTCKVSCYFKCNAKTPPAPYGPAAVIDGSHHACILSCARSSCLNFDPITEREDFGDCLTNCSSTCMHG